MANLDRDTVGLRHGSSMLRKECLMAAEVQTSANFNRSQWHKRSEIDCLKYWLQLH